MIDAAKFAALQVAVEALLSDRADTSGAFPVGFEKLCAALGTPKRIEVDGSEYGFDLIVITRCAEAVDRLTGLIRNLQLAHESAHVRLNKRVTASLCLEVVEALFPLLELNQRALDRHLVALYPDHTIEQIRDGFLEHLGLDMRLFLEILEARHDIRRTFKDIADGRQGGPDHA